MMTGKPQAADIRTMEDFAAYVGLSRPTVSKFFNDPASVRSNTRKRIEQAIGASGFRPNLFAVNLKRRRTRILGVIIPNAADPFYMELTRRIEEMVGLADDIRAMPMSMNTLISEGASNISGGQRQRILIAKSIVNHPRIIVFDEATSALDNRTQSIVAESLEKLKATRIIVAHRLSTICNADYIFVLDNGRIVESGTYDELMDQNGFFTSMAKRQLA